MSADLIRKAVKDSERHYGSLDKAERARVATQAQALWRHMTWGSAACMSPHKMLGMLTKREPPSAASIADGVASLARLQAQRGIRTIAPR